MPRQSRIDTPGALHHIIIRGIERQKIFQNDNDRNDFVERLETILPETSTACYSWALIPNHVHLLLRTGTTPVAGVMRKLLTGYAVTYNLRHNRHGQLFQNRYKSILCQEDPYFLELVRYIHLNPLRAKLVNDYDELCSYPYAGHSFILGKRKNTWQDIHYVLGFFNDLEGIARRQYRQYVEKGVETGSQPDLTGGGLIRSLGGWTDAKEKRKGRERIKGDERILGDNQFVKEVLKKSEDQFERKYELKRQGYNLKRLAEKVTKLFGISEEDLFQIGKYPKTVEARSVYFYWAVRELGHTATLMAKEHGLTQPAVSIAIKRGARTIREKGLRL